MASEIDYYLSNPVTKPDPESRKIFVWAIEPAITFVAFIFLAARFYARTYLKYVLGKDDWCMLAAMVVSITVTILHCVSTKWATGLHTADVADDWATKSFKITYASLILYAPAASLAKISICMTYLRILPHASDRLFAKIAIGFSICYCVSITLVMAFQCNPISQYWQVNNNDYNCINEPAFNFTAQLINSVSDVLIFLWPARTLWTVRVPVRQRLTLVFVFSVGAIVCIAGVFRLVFLYKYFQHWDVFWDGAVIFIFACLESNLGIICGCLPGIKPLLAHCFPRAFGTSSSERSNNYGRTGEGTPFRLPGARISIHGPRMSLRSPVRTHYHRPRSGERSASQESMVEVPIKLDEQWSPVSEPAPVAMSDLQIRRMDSRDEFGEMHPGNRLGEV